MLRGNKAGAALSACTRHHQHDDYVAGVDGHDGSKFFVRNAMTGSVSPAPAGGAPAGGSGDLIKETTTRDFVKDVIEASRTCRYWSTSGGLVRSLQTVDPDPGEGRHQGQGCGQARQDEHRQIPRDRRPASRPVDPRRLRLQGRPADRRLHGALPESQIQAFIDRVIGPTGPSMRKR